MKMLRNKRQALLLAAAFFPVMLIAQADSSKQVHRFSVDQAIAYASKNNVQVKNALLDVKYQEQVNREITSKAYPSINGSLGTSYNPNVATQVIPNFISPATYQVLVDEGVKDGNGNPIVMPNDFGFIAAQFGTKYSATAAISLNQILFDGQVFVGLQARSTTIDYQRKNVEITETMVRANIYKVYYQLVVSKQQVELIDENIALSEKLLRDARIMYENGFREKLEIDQVNVQLTNLQTEKQRVLTIISNGYYGLKVLMGMPVHEELVLTDTLTGERIREGMLEQNIYSYEDRKEFQAAQLGRKLNEYNIRRYKLSQFPTVSLSGSYAKSAQRDKWNFLGGGEWFTISGVNLNVSFPIFNGFYYKSKIEQAKIDLERTDNNIEALKLNIDNEVATARNNFRTAVLTMDAQQKNMELAETVYNQTKKKYEMGVADQTAINLAQTDLKAAQTNYINSLYAAIIARVDYLNATGRL